MYLYSNFFLIMKKFGVMVVCGIIGLLLLTWMWVINFGEKDLVIVDVVVEKEWVIDIGDVLSGWIDIDFKTWVDVHIVSWSLTEYVEHEELVTHWVLRWLVIDTRLGEIYEVEFDGVDDCLKRDWKCME
jgi:hypothetical protein